VVRRAGCGVAAKGGVIDGSYAAYTTSVTFGDSFSSRRSLTEGPQAVLDSGKEAVLAIFAALCYNQAKKRRDEHDCRPADSAL